MNGRQFEGVSDAELYETIEQGRQLLAEGKQHMADLEAEVSRRQENTAADIFRTAKKDHGSVSFVDNDGNKFKVEVKREVKWDSDKLQAIASGMSWGEVERTFDIKFNVPERIYNTMNDIELRTKLDTARTTKTSDMRVVFVGRCVDNGETT
jgi:hypothetical protein